MATIKLNNIEYTVKDGVTILEAAREAGISIPTLCNHPDLCVAGVCRICVVEVKGFRQLLAACATPITNGMEIKTYSHMVRKARRQIIQLMLADHFGDCTTCKRNQSCELQALAEEYGASWLYYSKPKTATYDLDESCSLIRDRNRCIDCKRCIRTCSEMIGNGVFEQVFKGHEHVTVDTFHSAPIQETLCINCGQCANRCPTGALIEQDSIEKIWAAIDDPAKHVVIQTAPAPRVAIGEEFGQAPGSPAPTKQLNTALKMMGFDRVFDTNFTADLTIMEEGTELLMRLKKALTGEDTIANATLPMMTSCSPGWIKFCEQFYPNQTDNLSTCKSPQQMFGAIIKTYYAEKMGINPKDIVVVSLMPCTAKKFEASRPEMNSSGYQDVDYVVTTRELARMIKHAGIHLMECPKTEFDDPIGLGSGAGVIFGATGGVMEAAIRTAYEIVTGREVPFRNLEIVPCRGMDGVREAELKIENVLPAWKFLEGATLKVAIAHGTINARKVMDRVKAGTAPWHFVEIMACPGGCLGGGGQPIPTNAEVRAARAKSIYEEDRLMPLRKSHDNPQVSTLYKEFLGSPLGHKSHKLLHTQYVKRGSYPIQEAHQMPAKEHSKQH